MTLIRSTPPVTVAMPAYNAERFLPQAVECILAQDFTEFEFLICDDGSEDRTRAIVESYAENDERIRVIHTEHRGLSAARNLMCEEARSPWIAHFDADDLCSPNRLSKQMAFLQENPDHGVVSSGNRTVD